MCMEYANCLRSVLINLLIIYGLLSKSAVEYIYLKRVKNVRSDAVGSYIYICDGLVRGTYKINKRKPSLLQI